MPKPQDCCWDGLPETQSPFFIEGQELQSECLRCWSVCLAKTRKMCREKQGKERQNEGLSEKYRSRQRQTEIARPTGFSCACLNHKLSHTLTCLFKLCQLSKYYVLAAEQVHHCTPTLNFLLFQHPPCCSSAFSDQQYLYIIPHITKAFLCRFFRQVLLGVIHTIKFLHNRFASNRHSETQTLNSAKNCK